MSSRVLRTRSPQASYPLLLVLIMGAAACSLARAEEIPTLEEIKAHLQQQREKIASLYVEFKEEEKARVDPKVLVSWAGYTNKLALVKDEVRFAFKGENRYVREVRAPFAKRLQPPGPPQVNPNAPPVVRESQKRILDQHRRAEREIAKAERMGLEVRRDEKPDVVEMEPDETRAYNGRTQWKRSVRQQGPAFVEISPPDWPAHWFQPPLYLHAVGLAVPDPTEKEEAPLNAQRMDLLPDLLERWPHTVSSEIEEIDGAPCVVLAAELQWTLTVGEVTQTFQIPNKLWLDLDHGLAIRQAERQHSGTRFRTVNSDFQEVLPGFWLPRRCQFQSFAPPDAPQQYQGRCVLVSDLEVVKWVVNQVPDDLFDMVPKPGDRVIDLRDPKWNLP